VRKLERILIFLLLLLATSFGQAFFAADVNPGDNSGQPVFQAAFGAIYLILLVLLILKHRSEALRIVKTEKWMTALCLWALMSVVWSVAPGETLRRAMAIIGTSIAGLYLAIKLEPKEQLRVMALVLGLGAFFSLIVAVMDPSVGIARGGAWEGSGWQGVYFQKNSLGRMMSFGAFAFALLAIGERRWRALRIAFFLLCCGMLFMSKSASAVVVTMVMLAMMPLRKLLYLRTRRLMAIGAAVLPLAAVFIFFAVEYADEILQSLGRTSSLTGRVPLWRLVLAEIAERPIRGWGYSAFWGTWEGLRVSDTVGWDVAVPHAHNGFLEIWLGLGIVGLGMVLISLARNLLLALRAARTHREPEFAWPLLMVAFTVLYNITEVSLMGVNSMPWMAYATVAFWLARFVRQEQALPALVEPEAQPAYSA
jgi:O-antigen ligase